MKRRTVLKRFGAAGIAGAALTGTATAKRPSDLDIEGPFDVSDMAGEYVVADLLSEEQLADAPADPALYERKVVIAPHADTIGTLETCCCCDDDPMHCDTDWCCEECPMV